MKKQFFLLAILLTTILCLNFVKRSADNKQSVNPVLGDISFISKFGHQPSATTSEILRIKTHLEYVENLLRNKQVSKMPAAQIQKRTNLLNLLHEYTGREIFPHNYDYTQQRKPCFIDKDGRICAVGYLIEQTAGREMAEEVNDKYKYEELLAMDDKAIDDWIAGNGLTKEECAMIQPTYGSGPNGEYSYVSPGYGVASSLLTAGNLATGIMNAMNISSGSTKRIVPIFGLAGGALQVILGAAAMPPRIDAYGYTNKGGRTVSFVNMGIGASTMILGAINLLTNKKEGKEKLTSWGIYSFPIPGNNTGMAFSLTRRF